MTPQPATPQDVKPSVRRMVVSPAIALNWLEHANSHNRTVSEAHVRRLARDMKAGRWQLTHEGIAFDPRGVLLDGQHRLWAVVESETAIETYVWFNISPEALLAINGGKPRSQADMLRLHGGHGSVTHTDLAVLRAMLGGLAGPVALTPAEASDALARHDQAIRFANEQVATRARGVAVSYVKAVIARAWYSVRLDALGIFCRVLSSGMAPASGDAMIIRLRDQLMAAGNVRSLGEQRALYGKVERTLRVWLAGETRTRITPVTQEYFPLPEEVETAAPARRAG